jgi:hypothetical protein
MVMARLRNSAKLGVTCLAVLAMAAVLDVAVAQSAAAAPSRGVAEVLDARTPPAGLTLAATAESTGTAPAKG